MLKYVTICKQRHETRENVRKWMENTLLFNVKDTTYLKPMSCSVGFDCGLFERSSSHHSGNDDWKLGKPSAIKKIEKHV